MKSALPLCLLLLWLPLQAQQPHQALFFFYNVENLMDTLDDPLKDDDDFTPVGSMHWTAPRYAAKLDSLAQAMRWLEETAGQPAAFYGLCEVENQQVIADLAVRHTTRPLQVVHYESGYHRGVDVALVYDATRMEVLRSQPIVITFPWDDTTTTRDILYVETLLDGRQLSLYICHWPSRRQDDRYRLHTAQLLRRHIDSLQLAMPQANILVMGDLNDECHNPSLTQGLGTRPAREGDPTAPTALYDLTTEIAAAGGYSYIYKNQRNLLDHVIVNTTLASGQNLLKLDYTATAVLADERLLQRVNDKTYLRRTYLGTRYMAGYSDHLPVYGIISCIK